MFIPFKTVYDRAGSRVSIGGGSADGGEGFVFAAGGLSYVGSFISGEGGAGGGGGGSGAGAT